MHQTRLVGSMVGGAALLAAVVVPAHADPAETFPLDDTVATIADDVNELVVFGNTTRQTFCTAEQVAAENAFLEWVQGGEQGDPPEFPVQLGAVPLEASAKDVGTGNVRFAFGGLVPVELWTFEEGKSTAQENLVGPCIDTDGLMDLTDTPVASGELFAAGQGSWVFKDNDAFGTGPRSNVWGDRLTADLSGPGGSYRYSLALTNHTVRGEYSGSASFTLRAR